MLREDGSAGPRATNRERAEIAAEGVLAFIGRIHEIADAHWSWAEETIYEEARQAAHFARRVREPRQ